MLDELVIVGSGGMGRETLVLANRINQSKESWSFIGFVDNQDGDGVVGNDEWLMAREKKTAVAIAVGSSELRNKLYHKYKENKNIVFPNLIDPDVIVGDESVVFGEGNIVCAGSIITTNVQIGNFNIINLNCTISHDSVIGDFVTISMGCNLSGNTVVNDLTEIGTGTQVIQGKKIGRNSIIGAGSVVIRDIGDFVTVVGVPGQVIKVGR
ncbi:MAG: acetyltransferase [Lachnospiraceae bacterium]|jgi:sugar O-acyltransferase (sialic acid O-acetyltransferase NeuD family)|nr:acetyltransferase [Lachnospiraceae bacterium]